MPTSSKRSIGNVSAASAGAIQRNLLALESQGADKFFGEPALDLDDLIQTDRAAAEWSISWRRKS